jgi:hypothetical protein
MRGIKACKLIIYRLWCFFTELNNTLFFAGVINYLVLDKVNSQYALKR